MGILRIPKLIWAGAFICTVGPVYSQRGSLFLSLNMLSLEKRDLFLALSARHRICILPKPRPVQHSPSKILLVPAITKRNIANNFDNTVKKNNFSECHEHPKRGLFVLPLAEHLSTHQTNMIMNAFNNFMILT